MRTENGARWINVVAGFCLQSTALSKYHIAALCRQRLSCNLYFKDALKIKLDYILISGSTATALWTWNGPREAVNGLTLQEQRSFKLESGEIFISANLYWHDSFHSRSSLSLALEG